VEIQRKTMHLGINRAGGQRAFAKTEHRFDMSMEAKCVVIQRKTLHLGINRAWRQHEYAKTEHRFDLSMENKMCRNSK